MIYRSRKRSAAWLLPVLLLAGCGPSITGQEEAPGDGLGAPAEAYPIITPACGLINAAITANCPIEIMGTMVLDGRNHALWSSQIIPNSGGFGVITIGALVSGDNCRIGGTTTWGQDVAPTRTGWEWVVEEFYNWSGYQPSTPEQVLGGWEAGWAPGALKNLAMTGFNGSQYVTDPAGLAFPLQGVTYVELPPGAEWNPVELGESGAGILVVHNDSLTASMLNVNPGVFRGLIIADQVLHLHVTVIGAIFILSPAPAAGYALGNGTGDLLFSWEALGTLADNLLAHDIN